MAAICSEHDVSLIQLIAPTTSESRAVEIAKTSSGFIYFVSVTGITGERRALPDDLASRIEWLKNHTDLPVCVGFGVSQPEQAAVLSQVADGVIVGSAIVRKLGEGQARETILAEVSDLVASMVTAIQR
jgi:tryptophan synthase alpha chain